MENEYSLLLRQKNRICSELRELQDTLVFVSIKLPSEFIGKFHLRTMITFVKRLSPELLESCRRSEGCMDYLDINGSVDDVVSILDLTMNQFDIVVGHDLYEAFISLIEMIRRDGKGHTHYLHKHGNGLYLALRGNYAI